MADKVVIRGIGWTAESRAANRADPPRKSATRRVAKGTRFPYGDVGTLLWDANEPIEFIAVRPAKRIGLAQYLTDRLGVVRYLTDGLERQVVIPARVKMPSLGRWPGRRLPAEWAHPAGWVVIRSWTRAHLSEMHAADCAAEGIMLDRWVAEDRGEGLPCLDRGLEADAVELREKFRAHWDAINAARGFSFAQNPVVWVIGYSPAEAPAIGLRRS